MARAPQEKAKRIVEARDHKPKKSDKDYRFLTKETKRECRVKSLLAAKILIDP